ncbi:MULTISPECIES: DUF427 domain-containing protein [Streptomycetaceae]|uniref:DUF427 domain-containing protein n=1 Tax=Streptantibioticus cattleyicolor (strain ATCC 35852 / DSM 46488 / JCM 4925 / NBRC 14057 / NRRL 8057) TaxID=1003195 RepID=F8K1E5_STREN|nr:DUF427 domain-containing protein [Streptantibioticus cattleyicolor]AEW97440.1 hypothetical protein SCATT_50690 [Streptantibioticus cattleyicolor NRRL 8057 = DSM 46488]MYS61878.1 DUF427 domain-containing protein [Streptomyces sp. SID5468]CCB77760.1 conserved protein of unknown function [Streptantibioticus cattleyicolor NRRL 8057 = DSM 46488]
MTERTKGHHVTVAPSTQHVRVVIDGQVVADTRRPVVLRETGLPIRYYLPPDDVDLTLFEPTATRTTCPFKGEAAYWTYRGEDGSEHRDVVWAYPDPLPEVALIKGHLSFYDTVARITVEGEPPAAPGA